MQTFFLHFPLPEFFDSIFPYIKRTLFHTKPRLDGAYTGFSRGGGEDYIYKIFLSPPPGASPVYHLEVES